MNIRDQFIKSFLQHACPPGFGEGTATHTMYRDKAVALIECNDTAFVMFKQGVASAVRDRPTVYLSEFSNGVGGKPAVSISNLSMDVSGPDHSWDNNSMFLVQPGHNGKGVIRMSDTLTTLRNILGNAGIITVTE